MRQGGVSASRLTNRWSAARGSTAYAYDAVGNLTNVAYPVSHGIALRYDALNRLTNQVDGAGTTVYSYDAAGQLTNAGGLWPSDTVSYTYANRLRTGLSLASPVGVAWSQCYTYDAAGNLNARTNNALVQTFGVNTLNELTASTNSGRLTVAGSTTITATNVTVNTSNALLYADDSFASTNQPWAAGANTYLATARDAYGNSNSSSVTVTLANTNLYSYDLNGNLLSDGTRNFAYDDENELISVWRTNVWRNDFVYDGKLRRRVERDFTWSGSAWAQTNETRFVYDGNLVVEERNTNNQPVVTYTRGNDLSGTLQGAGGIGGLLARTDGNGSTFYHADGNGNVTALLNASQTVVAKYLYDAFGNTLAESGALAEANAYRFSSKEWNANSGLYYYLYRFYDPNLQRWVNRETLGDEAVIRKSAKNLNSYYAWNLRSESLENPFEFNNDNPNGFIDKDGRQIAIPIGIGIGIGVLFGTIWCDLNPWCQQHVLHLPPITGPRFFPSCPTSKSNPPDSTERCELILDDVPCTYNCERTGYSWFLPGPNGECKEVISIPYQPEQ